MSAPFFELQAVDPTGARAGVLHTEHGDVPTPVFMPVGTQGAVKTATAEQLESIGARLILANTYHLYLRPGAARVEATGGVHGLAAWRGARPAEMAGSAVHGRLVCDFLRILDPASGQPPAAADEEAGTPGIHRKCAPGATPEPLADWLKTLAPVLEENDVEPLADRLRARLPQFVSTGQGGN